MNIKKNIRIWPIEMDENWIWFSDVWMGGLYRYHWCTREMICEIDPITLYHLNIFRIGGIISWMDYVVICPVSIYDPIAIFSKKTRNLKTVHILGVERDMHLDGIREIGGCLYLNLYHSNVAVLVIKLSELCNSKTKEVIPQIIFYPDHIVHTAWFAKHLGKGIYLPAYNEKMIYKVENNNISSIAVNIPQNIFTMCFYMSEMWILSVDGWELYKVDLNGKLLEVISIERKDFPSEKRGAHNIIITANYIFILFRRNSLGCYDRKRNCMINLKLFSGDLENQYPNELPGTFLFGIEKNNKLFLLPYGNRGLEINLCTLECEYVDILFPNKMREDKIIYYTEIAIAHNGGRSFSDIHPKSLSAYLNYIVSDNVLNIFNKHSEIKIGKKIYQIHNRI